MRDFNVILVMDWLSPHRISGLFYEESCVSNIGFSKLEFEGNRRVLPTCVILALEAKRLLHKGCEAYLAHVIDTSTPKVTLESARVLRCVSRGFAKLATR